VQIIWPLCALVPELRARQHLSGSDHAQAVAVATLASPFLGAPSSLFGFVPLSAPEMGTIIAIVVGYIVATEAAQAP